jgi:acetyltransferase-like isoleucine patch superfamily enzyme/acyl carrier protein
VSSAWQRLVVRRQLRACTYVGRDVRIDGQLHVANLGSISIGSNVHIRSATATSHLVTSVRGALVVGDGVSIGHGAAIACHEKITIGVRATIGPFAMIMDTDFHQAGNYDNPGDTGPIVIGPGVVVGTRVMILRGTTIGEGTVIASGSVVRGQIPANSYVAGVPARVVPQPSGIGGYSEPTPTAVCELVSRTFALTAAPTPATRRTDVMGWDVVGSYNLMLDIEQSFGVRLDVDAVTLVTTVGDLVSLLNATSPSHADP